MFVLNICYNSRSRISFTTNCKRRLIYSLNKLRNYHVECKRQYFECKKWREEISMFTEWGIVPRNRLANIFRLDVIIVTLSTPYRDINIWYEKTGTHTRRQRRYYRINSGKNIGQTRNFNTSSYKTHPAVNYDSNCGRKNDSLSNGTVRFVVRRCFSIFWRKDESKRVLSFNRRG